MNVAKVPLALKKIMTGRLMTMLLFLLSFLTVLGNKTLPDVNKQRHECSSALEKKNFKSCIESAKRLRLLAEQAGDEKAYAYSGFFLGTGEIFAGDGRKGGDYLREAFILADSLRCDSLMALTLNGLGIYEANVNNNYYLAQRYFLRSLEYPGIEGSVYSNLAQVARLQKDSSGMVYARKCYDYGIKNKDSYYIFGGLVARAEFHIFKEEYDSALNLIEEARRV